MNITLETAWNKRDKLWAEGAKLKAEGDKLWAEAIIKIKGNIKIEWEWIPSKESYRCKLETGEIFEPVAVVL